MANYNEFIIFHIQKLVIWAGGGGGDYVKFKVVWNWIRYFSFIFWGDRKKHTVTIITP